ncbi:MAG: response regulator [Nitrospira sp.]|nr:response regulator [Nitrospira sp.]
MTGYGKRVLIIDDAQDLHYLTAMVLANVGYNVYSAFDGLEGLHEMKKRRYDVVLVDYHMPRLDGLQFVEISRTTWPETPIILLSGDASVSDRPDRVPGLFGCLSKPFELPQLLELVNQACCDTGISRRFESMPRTKEIERRSHDRQSWVCGDSFKGMTEGHPPGTRRSEGF